MYLNHFGIRDKPFKLAHDPAYYFPAAHQVPLNELCYSIEERQGIAMLIGEPGTGKTTLLRRLLQSFGPKQRGVFISDPSVVGESLLRLLATELRISLTNDGGTSFKSLRSHLAGMRDQTFVFIVDEAQGLTPHQFDEVRHLSNLEVPGRKLLEIILSGQPSLDSALSAPQFVALKQRVAVRCRMGALDLKNTRAYIEHRLRIAGAPNTSLFTPDAIRSIFHHSRGVPRLINIVGDRALVVGYLESTQVIDVVTVEDAVADLRLEEQQTSTPQLVQAVGDSVLTQLAARIETIEEKLNRVIDLLTQEGKSTKR